MKRRHFLQLSIASPLLLSCEPTGTKQPRQEVAKLHPIKTDVAKLPSTQIQYHEILPPGRYTVQVVMMKITAYCPCVKCCGRWADGVTASGHVISAGDKFVAADTKRYPFGTGMSVPGYSYVSTKGCNYGTVRQIARVLDRGGAIKGNHIDVYFDTHQEALNWGVQFLDVTVYVERKE